MSTLRIKAKFTWAQFQHLLEKAEFAVETRGERDFIYDVLDRFVETGVETLLTQAELDQLTQMAER